MKAFHCQRKSHMTLLETLIAVSLLSVLLVLVFGFFRELSEITRMTEQKQKESFQKRYLESRLGFIFERIVHEDDKARKFFFYTQASDQALSSSPSLVLTFDNEARLDPTFSGDVLGKIYVDEDRRLCLAIWPLYVKEPEQYLQEEVLMEHVMGVTYSFYAAPERIHDSKDIASRDAIDPEKKTPEKDKWHEDWHITYEQMPSIMKMGVKVAKREDQDGETEEFSFCFVLPSSKNYVYYPPGRLSS